MSVITSPTFSFRDSITVSSLLKDSRLTFDERAAIQNALKRLEELETEKSWRNPYTEAIALLENAARGHEGGYG